ncbi:MAG: DUF1553 domain-containing protein, partial [Planctomycetaceae bacterium]
GDHYRQQQERGPENKFPWRGKRGRRELEQMRDTRRSGSRRLHLAMYGRPGPIDELKFRRRTIYTFVERQNVPSVVQTFDAANPDSSTARRVNTTVPQQALFAMNSPFVGRAARLIADKSRDTPSAERLNLIYTTILGRKPTAAELALGLEFVERGPWEHMTHILLMTNELMFVD